MDKDRFDWAVNLLKIRAGSRILEIGCGTGLSLPRLALLHPAHITAIDRSPAMIKLARKKIKDSDVKERMHFITGDFKETAIHTGPFDCIFAFNVSVFLKDPADELKKIRSLLAPRAKFFQFYQPPVTGKTMLLAERATEVLTQHAFKVLNTVYQDFKPAAACCIVSKPV